ncbi:exportin-4-like, partial [Phalaenopsis equestris]|uniref:exportin-4-like n=1 Tax=Phalaenopsis equestris TaxID=78828 RepID=UPI0009E6335B
MNGFPGEPVDVLQLKATMDAVEHACSLIRMHVSPLEAEELLVFLRKSPMPYQSCWFILENSQMPNARFQAAAAIGDAARREWGVLTDENKRCLILYCLRYATEHASASDAYVQVKVSVVAAQLLKRGWLEFAESEKSDILYQVKHAVLGAHGVDAQVSGITFLESLVSEFSLTTSTALGLPREFHEQCHLSFESTCLKVYHLRNFIVG